MSAGSAIEVNNVHKHYLIYPKPEDRLKQMFAPKLARLTGRPVPQYYKNFPAVNGVSFNVGRGETVGIVGRNGSGKSTLLQMICGTLNPTSGSISVRGRIAALLELGSGFNPEFTGRENVFLNAAILGLTREQTEARFDRIEKFADIGDFIDQPIKTYSSGMHVRLAFAVAINVDPEILIVDEALAVGDEAFQRKCFARIEHIREQGATILFVSHGSQTIIQLCDRAILMDRGEILLDGKPRAVVRHYQRLINAVEDQAEVVRSAILDMKNRDDPELSVELSAVSGMPASATGDAVVYVTPASGKDDADFLDPNLVVRDTLHYSSDGAEISEIRFETLSGEQVNVMNSSTRYRVRYKVGFNRDAHQVAFGFQIKSVSGLVLAGSNTSIPQDARLKYAPAGSTTDVRAEFTCNLLPGTYFVDVGAHSFGAESRFMHRVVDALMFRVQAGDASPTIGNTFIQPSFEVRTSFDTGLKQHVS